MEPLTTAAVVVGAAVATKILENVGENIGDTLSQKTTKFLESLNQESPGAMIAIEQAPEQPLDYGQAVLEIESAAQTNSQVAEAMQELVAAAEANPHPKLAEVLEEIKKSLNSQQPSIHNENKAKLQEKGIINQGVIQHQDVTIT